MGPSITISDQDSKLGTQLDGEQIRGQTRVLTDDEHHLRLGNFASVIHIKQFPVVLSFSFSSKELKKDDPLAPLRERLEGLDVKVIIPFVREKTTHVVAGKRNTTKGLHALINGKYIVTEAFVEAIEKATSPSNTEGVDSVPPLEEDFDAHWPEALQFLPAPSKEPIQRPEALFAPDSSRLNIFEGYTFIFCDQTQFEALQAPITDGGGKALKIDLEIGKTTSEDIVRFARSAAGEKGTAEVADRNTGKGVVVVRFACENDDEAWSIELGDEVAKRLNLRLIQQNEFLDAILVNDASRLRQPLTERDAGIVNISALAKDQHPESRASAENIVAARSEDQISQPVSKRARSRRLVTSRFQGFDDGFNASTFTHAKRHEGGSGSEDGPDMASGQHRPDVVEDSEVELDADDSTTQKRGKKRHPPSSSENDEEAMDEILPAAAQMKRRRIEEEKSNQAKPKNKAEAKGSKPPAPAPHTDAKGRKVKKEPDVLEAARGHRKAEEEAARQDREEDWQASLDGMSVAEMKKLAIVEEIPITTRTATATGNTRRQNAASNRWDDSWNGRKNFKRFHRAGPAETEGGDNEGAARRRRAKQGVIVSLEEVRKKNFGIGEDYWINNDDEERMHRQAEKRQKATRQRSDRSQPPVASDLSPPIVTTQASESEPFTTARSRRSQSVAIEEDNYNASHHRPTTRLADKSQPSLHKDPSQPLSNTSKRPASSTSLAQSSKKQKTSAGTTQNTQSRTSTRTQSGRSKDSLFVRASDDDDDDLMDEEPPPQQLRKHKQKQLREEADEDDDDDDDGLRFRFRKKN
ncbi:MAG: hypothetical protein M4579_005800 [Chaenotheca gracillima]|nr:MAG: hypothetical protein M4579_005800 [Chaenotheca gracillima]